MPVTFTRFLSMRQLALYESAVVSAGMLAVHDAFLQVITSYVQNAFAPGLNTLFTSRMSDRQIEQAFNQFEGMMLEQMDSGQREAFELVNRQFIESFGDVVNDHYDGDIPYRTTYEEWLETESGNDRVETIVDNYVSEMHGSIDGRMQEGRDEGLSADEVMARIEEDIGIDEMQARYAAFANTEIMEAFRSGNRELSLELANELPGTHEWEWLSAHDSSVCIACLAMDGKRFDLDDYPDIQHVSCRCQIVLRLDERYETTPHRETGEEWLAKQDEETQRKILGSEGRYASYKMGMPLDQMVRYNHHPEWGTSIGPKPIRIRTLGSFGDGSLGALAPGSGPDVQFWGVSLNAGSSDPFRRTYDDWKEAPVFSSKAEALSWLGETYPQTIWELDSIDQELVNVIAQQHHRLARDWPDVAAGIQRVTDYSQTPQIWEQYQGQVAHANMTLVKRTKTGPSSMEDTVIGLNPQYFGDARTLEAHLHAMEGRGFHPPGSSTSLASIYTHEFGHHVDFWLGNQSEDIVHEYVLQNGTGTVGGTHNMWRDRAHHGSNNPLPSDYSRTSDRESFAEGFTAIYHGTPDTWNDYVEQQQEYLSWIGNRDSWLDRNQRKNGHESIQTLRDTLNWFNSLWD